MAHKTKDWATEPHWKQTMIYKTLHRKLKIEQQNLTENKQWSTKHYIEN